MTDAREAAVHVEPYDPSWPSRFQAEHALLAAALGPWLVGPIEHVGSTAVPGLEAKPVIDIMAGVESLDASRGAFGVLGELGYKHAAYRTEVMHWFCKPDFSFRTHHLHLVPYLSPLWRDRLAFRDHLVQNPCVAREYAELKLRLAAEHRLDREAYTQAKGPFIERVLEQALPRR